MLNRDICLEHDVCWCAVKPILAVKYTYNILQTQVHNNDSLLSSNGSNYLNTSLNLEDVYSVINKDTSLNATRKHVSPLVANSIYKFPNGIASPHASPQEINIVSESSITPLSSPLERGTPSPTESGSTPISSTIGKGTPSPNKDSGIESDTSPVSYHSTGNVDKVRKINTFQTNQLSPMATYIPVIHILMSRWPILTSV